ncbi:LPXTG cell wall anchor domain-containing protein [Macrococcus caseolyticus]|uniref:LPXTG cell wall anchor domain-containing protein n=1 Tax=Macrococcoides caseolyticum TaxID=69966 RepID=UPI0012FE8DB9
MNGKTNNQPKNNNLASKNSTALPQTGEKSTSSVSILGVLLLILGSLTSWFTYRKKREN